jgi:hypothetical protein
MRKARRNSLIVKRIPAFIDEKNDSTNCRIVLGDDK